MSDEATPAADTPATPPAAKAPAATPAPPEVSPEIQARLDAADSATAELAKFKAEKDEADKAAMSAKELEEKALQDLRDEKAALEVDLACTKAEVPAGLRSFVKEPAQAATLMGAFSKAVAAAVKATTKAEGDQARINPAGDDTPAAPPKRIPKHKRSNPFADMSMGRKAS